MFNSGGNKSDLGVGVDGGLSSESDVELESPPSDVAEGDALSSSNLKRACVNCDADGGAPQSIT
jgi:hypothetical protein